MTALKPTPQPRLPLGHAFRSSRDEGLPDDSEGEWCAFYCEANPNGGHGCYCAEPRSAHTATESPGEVRVRAQPHEAGLSERTPPPSATPDDERARLVSEAYQQHPVDETEPGSCQFEYPCVTRSLAAQVASDGKRIAELSAEVERLRDALRLLPKR